MIVVTSYYYQNSNLRVKILHYFFFSLKNQLFNFDMYSIFPFPSNIPSFEWIQSECNKKDLKLLMSNFDPPLKKFYNRTDTIKHLINFAANSKTTFSLWNISHTFLIPRHTFFSNLIATSQLLNDILWILEFSLGKFKKCAMNQKTDGRLTE